MNHNHADIVTDLHARLESKNTVELKYKMILEFSLSLNIFVMSHKPNLQMLQILTSI
jgi:hypothetical protein